MTRIEVAAGELLALGDVLSGVAEDLRWQARHSSGQTWALGPGHSAAALATVLGDFEHQRQVLGRELAELAAGTHHAGRLYAEVEQGLAASMAVPVTASDSASVAASVAASVTASDAGGAGVAR